MSTPNPTPLPGGTPLIDSSEVQAVKKALNADVTDAGVGLYHIPTNRVYLRPVSQTNPAGHTSLVQQLRFNTGECRGFVIAKHSTTGQFVVENISGLNIGSGGTGMGMPQALFDAVRQALLAAGL